MKNLNVNELTLDNIARWPWMIKIGLIVFISLLFIFLGYWFVTRTYLDDYAEAFSQENNLKMEFESKRSRAANLEAYQLQLKDLNERFSSALRQLPAKNEMPDLLEEISKTGVSTGLKFILFAPQKEVEHDFYVELPIEMEVVGTYHQLAYFLSRVAQMNRIVTLHDFSIMPLAAKVSAAAGLPKAEENQVAVGTHEQLVMNLTAKIYRYRVP